ncbi:hypothetical protein F4809DRAFT_634189, partial [Biscogniauxia mediterranea]
MGVSLFISILLPLLLCPSLAAVSRCYYPDGEISPDYPCNADLDSSACCGGSAGSVCLSNNLCQTRDGDVIRGSCSDQYWGAAECAHYCLSSVTGGVNLISCSNVTNDDTSFCCDNTDGCCDSGDGRFSVAPHNPTTYATWHTLSSRYVVLEAVSTSTPVTSSSSPTSSSSIQPTQATQTSSPSPTAANSPPGDSSDLSTGAKAGIGVGAGVGVVVIILLSYVLWRLRKHHGQLNQYSSARQQGFHDAHNTMATNNMAGPLSSYQKTHPISTELYGQQYHAPHELPGNS